MACFAVMYTTLGLILAAMEAKASLSSSSRATDDGEDDDAPTVAGDGPACSCCRWAIAALSAIAESVTVEAAMAHRRRRLRGMSDSPNKSVLTTSRCRLSSRPSTSHSNEEYVICAV